MAEATTLISEITALVLVIALALWAYGWAMRQKRVDEKEERDALDLFQWLNDEYVKVEPFTPTGADAADVGWRFIQCHQSEPRERVFYEHYRDDLLEATQDAIEALERGWDREVGLHAPGAVRPPRPWPRPLK